MRPRFHPRLINGPFDDPGLYIPFLFQQHAMIFDLGDITCLSAKDLLKISQAFITHTHMDHFIGFDRLLRTVLGREKTLALFGPAGFIKNVEGKLAGYAWNLVGNYNYPLNLEITEVNSQSTVYRRYRCRDKFIPTDESFEQPFNGILYEEPGLTVTAAILDHGIPCLGLAVKEHFHVNILKDGLKKLGLDPGPWLADFKQALYSRSDPATKFELRFGPGKKTRHYRLGKLAAKIALITPGQKISYITDVAYNQSNSERIVALVKESDHLFIEAAFLDTDKDIAAEKNHLTAAQAGSLAAMARVKQFSVFHFSPRYTGEEQRLKEEARLAYEKQITEDS
ncbi:MAG: ribonuclease Z [Proteobacteria bacterium]|nr:ribonuclease Z [Pseudomonadota bacterium]